MKNKIKTKRSAKKRIKITGSGKLKKYSPGKRHLLEHKKPGRKRSLSSDSDVSKSDVKKIKKMMPGI
mgnify:CR=1 FL=1